jgi:hypothetical protein
MTSQSGFKSGTHANVTQATKSKTGAARAPVLSDLAIGVDQELALSTVTERRFCDQHEMSLQTATGRSLP